VESEGAGSGSHIAGLYFENVKRHQVQYVRIAARAPAMNDIVDRAEAISCRPTAIPSPRSATQHRALCHYQRQAHRSAPGRSDHPKKRA